MGRFKEWVCKLEGKPLAKVARAKVDYSPLPENITNHGLLHLCIRDVIAAGVGGSVPQEGSRYNRVDFAFEWQTHPLESEWSDLYESGVVCEDVYSACLSWRNQLDGYASF